jgi:GNAT superfamily N-acetyltransferase
MSSVDARDVIEFVRAHYPEVSAGAESGFCEPSFFEECVAMVDRDYDRPIAAFVIHTSSGALVAFLSVEHDPRARVLHGRLALVHPAHRRSGLGRFLGGDLVMQLATALRVELIMTYATLTHSFSQALLEAEGYMLVGIVPAHDRDSVAPGTVKRVWEALYARVLVEDDAVLAPSPAALGEAAGEMYRLIRELAARAASVR